MKIAYPMSSIEVIAPRNLQPAELLHYLPAYRVVICVSCQYAVQPDGISRHLKDVHKIHRARRRPFMDYVSKLELYKPQDVTSPTTDQFPVPLLPVQKGLRCENAGCSHLCVSIKRMQSHWISVHGRSGQESLDWRPALLQTFFRGNALRYFTNSTPTTNSTKQIPCSHLVTDAGCKNFNADGDDALRPLNNNLISHGALNSTDTVLLRHYLDSTCMTIATDVETKIIWQSTVPQLADQHLFLLHGILACSALHLAYSNPAEQRELTIRANIHQDRAMPSFRSAISNVNKENCDAILAFSHLLVIYAFASENQDERLFLVDASGSEVLPSWLYFLRNGCSLLCSVWDRIESGPVRDLAAAWDIPITVPEDATEDLHDYLLSVVLPQSSQKVWPNEICQLYRHTAAELASAFSCTRALGKAFSTWDALRLWPMKISVEYLDLLRSYHPGALILLAHYCILLQKLEPNWYFEGRAARLLSSVLHHLETRWHSYIRWALDVIRSSSAEFE